MSSNLQSLSLSSASSSSPFPQRLVSQSFENKSAQLSGIIARSLPYEMSYSLNIPTRLPNVLFDQMAEYLSVRGIAHLSQMNSALCHRVSQIRGRFTHTHLDFSNTAIDDVGLAIALKQHPHFTGIDLRGCPNITGKGIRLLAQAISGKKMKKVLLAAHYNPRLPQSYPVTLEHLRKIYEKKDMEGTFCTDMRYIQFWQMLHSTYPSIAHVMHKGDPHFINPNPTLTHGEQLALAASIDSVSIEDWDFLIDHLDFSEMEEFDLSNTLFKLDEYRAGSLLKKLDSCAKLKIFRVEFDTWSNKVSSKMLFNLVQALPISQMKEIYLQTDGLDAEIIDYLSTQLEVNSNLECLFIGTQNDIGGIEAISRLLASINSTALRLLWISSEVAEGFQAVEESPEIRGILLEKLPRWTRLEKVYIQDIISLHKLRLTAASVAPSFSEMDDWSARIEIADQIAYKDFDEDQEKEYPLSEESKAPDLEDDPTQK